MIYKPKIHVAFNLSEYMLRLAGSMCRTGQQTPIFLSNRPRCNYLVDRLMVELDTQ